MKRSVFLTALLALSLAGFAQKAKKEKVYDKVYYKITNAEAGDIQFKVDDAVGMEDELKMKLVVINTSGDYYIFKASECVLIADGKEYPCAEKPLTLDPGEKDYKVLNFTAKGLNKFHQFTLKLGGIYKITSQGDVMAGPPFDLPPLKNFFQAGPFKYELISDKRSSSGSEFKFNVTYIGDKVGIVRPVFTTLKMPTGNEFQNEVSSKKCLLLQHNESGKLKLNWTSVSRKEGDQQFCKMQLIWHETAMESPMEKMPEANITCDWDVERTTN
jgi:hypothetical protein